MIDLCTFRNLETNLHRLFILLMVDGNTNFSSPIINNLLLQLSNTLCLHLALCPMANGTTITITISIPIATTNDDNNEPTGTAQSLSILSKKKETVKSMTLVKLMRSARLYIHQPTIN